VAWDGQIQVQHAKEGEHQSADGHCWAECEEASRLAQAGPRSVAQAMALRRCPESLLFCFRNRVRRRDRRVSRRVKRSFSTSCTVFTPLPHLLATRSILFLRFPLFNALLVPDRPHGELAVGARYAVEVPS
jgi:hypothetical protein